MNQRVEKNIHFLTSTYPPYRGGIGFHTVNLARGLSARGYRVFIWSAFDKSQRQKSRIFIDDFPVTLNDLGADWSLEAFSKVRKAILEYPGDVMIQYRPHAFQVRQSYELRAFVKKLSKLSSVRLHIVAHRLFEWPQIRSGYMWRLWAPLSQLLTLRHLLRHSRCFYLTSTHLSGMAKVCLMGKKKQYLPVSSYIYSKVNDVKTENLNKAFRQQSSFIIGTFSSFIELRVLDILSAVLAVLLRHHPTWRWLFFGRYSQGFVKFLQGKYPALSERMDYAGELDLQALSAHIQISDVIFQPYDRGVSTRRTTAMAVLDHGIPMVTSSGVYTEPIWYQSGCVELVDDNNVDGFIQAIEGLAGSEDKCKELSVRARQTYEKYFSLQKSMEIIEGCSVSSRSRLL